MKRNKANRKTWFKVVDANLFEKRVRDIDVNRLGKMRNFEAVGELVIFERKGRRVMKKTIDGVHYAFDYVKEYGFALAALRDSEIPVRAEDDMKPSIGELYFPANEEE